MALERKTIWKDVEKNRQEFARLRKRSFHNAVAALIVLGFVFVLLFIMMGSNVDYSNIYKFRTFTFIVGLIQIAVIVQSSQKMFKLQKEHPEWLAETSAFKNKVTEPKEWKLGRLGVMIAVLGTIIISFITWYKPESKNIAEGNDYQSTQSIRQNTADSRNNTDYQNAVGAIDEIKTEIQTITYQCIVGDPIKTELLIITSDGTGQKYTITLSENQNFDYFRDEFPSESEYEMEEFTIADEEWEALVSVIYDNAFTSLPEVLPEEDEVYDGSEYAIQVETLDEVYLVEGGSNGDSTEEVYQRFNVVRDALNDISVSR